MGKIYAGSQVRLKATFTNPATGALMDVTTPKLRVTPEGGVQADISGSIVRDSLGTYHADYLASAAGTLVYRWSSEAAGEESFGDVKSLKVSPL